MGSWLRVRSGDLRPSTQSRDLGDRLASPAPVASQRKWGSDRFYLGYYSMGERLPSVNSSQLHQDKRRGAF